MVLQFWRSQRMGTFNSLIQGPSVVRPVKIEHDETCAKGAGNWDEAKDEGNKKATNQATKWVCLNMWYIPIDVNFAGKMRIIHWMFGCQDRTVIFGCSAVMGPTPNPCALWYHRKIYSLVCWFFHAFVGDLWLRMIYISANHCRSLQVQWMCSRLVPAAELKWHISLFGYAPNLFTSQYSNPDMIPLNTDRSWNWGILWIPLRSRFWTIPRTAVMWEDLWVAAAAFSAQRSTVYRFGYGLELLPQNGRLQLFQLRNWVSMTYMLICNLWIHQS